jgi:hypothetical protein
MWWAAFRQAGGSSVGSIGGPPETVVPCGSAPGEQQLEHQVRACSESAANEDKR